jgi:ABC-type nitrate/sulfonate/bicarbonate transport system substrate-binding protein
MIVKKKHVFILALALAVSLLFAGCGGSPAQNTAGTSVPASDAAGPPDDPAVTLRYGFVDVTNGVLTSVAGIAYEQGFFEEELAKVNAKIEILGFTGAGPAINAALASSSLDAASIGDVPAIVAKANGADTIVVSGSLSDQPTYLLAQPGHGYQSFQDLKGKRVATQVGAYMHRTMILMLQDEGMSVSDIEFVNMSANDARTALAAKSVDAIVVQSTAAISLIQEGLGEVVVSTEGHPDWLNGSCGLIRKAFADQNPQVVAAFLKALIRASEYAADGRKDLLRDLAIRGGITPEDIDILYPSVTDFTTQVAMNEETLKILESVNAFLVENQITPSPVDIRSWYDGSYYETAQRELAES